MLGEVRPGELSLYSLGVATRYTGDKYEQTSPHGMVGGAWSGKRLIRESQNEDHYSTSIKGKGIDNQ